MDDGSSARGRSRGALQTAHSKRGLEVIQFHALREELGRTDYALF